MKQTTGRKHESAGALIYELSKAAQVFFQYQFGPYSIGPAQIRTLIVLSRTEGLTQNEIAEQLNLDKSSITSQMKILEGNGYIVRQRHPEDSRKQRISITQKTRDLLDPLMTVFASWTTTLLGGFDRTERAQVMDYLKRMNANAAKKLNEIQEQDERL